MSYDPLIRLRERKLARARKLHPDKVAQIELVAKNSDMESLEVENIILDIHAGGCDKVEDRTFTRCAIYGIVAMVAGITIGGSMLGEYLGTRKLPWIRPVSEAVIAGSMVAGTLEIYRNQAYRKRAKLYRKKLDEASTGYWQKACSRNMYDDPIVREEMRIFRAPQFYDLWEDHYP